jgi:hypothetical protein
MRRQLRSPRFWILVFSALAVLWLGLIDLRRTAPGELSGAHQQVSDLVGFGSCAQCHGGWLSSIGLGGARSPHETMAAACQHCHKEIGPQIAAGTGFHGVMGRDQAIQCATCHSEHHGPEFAMVNRQSFLRAGVDGRDAFRHETIGFAMDGRHLEHACVVCHVHADAFQLQEGQKRFLGLDQDCATCHHDAHEGSMGHACATCHGQTAFHWLDPEDHDRFLPLVGGHARLACRTCHAQGTSHALESYGRGTPPPARTCAECHQSPHAPAFVKGVAAIEKRSEGAVCVTCHGPQHLKFRDPRVTTTKVQHLAAGFALELPHDTVPCARCHVPDGESFALRYPGRAAGRCAHCHTDVHQGQFDTGPFASEGCVACHDRQRWTPHAFTPREHERAALPLDGRHLETECGKCHELPKGGGPRQFRGTSDRCETCHPDGHDKFFHRLAGVLGETRHGACAACHTTNRFAELPPDGFAHGRFTQFPVEGAHAEAGCQSCHPRTATPDKCGRTFGRVSARFGALPENGHACVPCHKDPHAGRFDQAKMPRTVEGRPGCARCHQASTFRTLLRRFDHGPWTGYPLEGAHGKARCSACHAPLPKADPEGRTWERAVGRACADCHQDPHAGQFAQGGRISCERCHQNAAVFKELKFDHQKDSRFPLSEAHRKVKCASCHKPAAVGDQEVLRYRPMEMECVDCHGEHEDPLKRRKQGP